MNFPKERALFLPFFFFFEDTHLQGLWEANCGYTSHISPLQKKKKYKSVEDEAIKDLS